MGYRPALRASPIEVWCPRMDRGGLQGFRTRVPAKEGGGEPQVRLPSGRTSSHGSVWCKRCILLQAKNLFYTNSIAFVNRYASWGVGWGWGVREAMPLRGCGGGGGGDLSGLFLGHCVTTSATPSETIRNERYRTRNNGSDNVVDILFR